MKHLKSEELVNVLQELSRLDGDQFKQNSSKILKALEAAASRIESLTFKAESQLVDETWNSIYEANEQQEYVINRLSKMPVENDGDLIFQMQCTAAMYLLFREIDWR